MSHLFTEKNIKLFVKTLFERYIQVHGYSLSNLDGYKISSISQDFPSVFYEVKGNVSKSLISDYALELVSRGLLQRSTECALYFNITAKGYTEGYKVKHPVKYFFLAHWQWFFGCIIIGLIGALATLLAG